MFSWTKTRICKRNAGEEGRNVPCDKLYNENFTQALILKWVMSVNAHHILLPVLSSRMRSHNKPILCASCIIVMVSTDVKLVKLCCSVHVTTDYDCIKFYITPVCTASVAAWGTDRNSLHLHIFHDMKNCHGWLEERQAATGVCDLQFVIIVILPLVCHERQ